MAGTTFDSSIWGDVRARFLNEPFKMKQHGDHLREGVCPQCGKKTLWTKHAAEPAIVWCDRENNCGYTATAKELFPDLFDARRVMRDNPPTPENPTATADAWLRQIRGFDISTIRGWYTQHSYNYQPKEAKEAGQRGDDVTAIRFLLPPPMVGAWDRFLDGEHFGKKTYLHYGSKLNGWLWTPPGQKLARGDTLYITEGIFDALALLQTGRKVGAIMGATNKPLTFITEHAALKLRYIVALDNDPAGQKNAMVLVKWFRDQKENVSCIQPAADASTKIDWNDLHKAGKLTADDFREYDYYGQLLTAASAEQRGTLMYSKTGNQFFVYEHRRSTHVWNLDIEKLTKAQDDIRRAEKLADEDELNPQQLEDAIRKCGAVAHLANCGLDFLYTQKNPITDELFYFFRVRHVDGRESLNTLTGAQLSAAADFRKRLLSMASGALMRADQEAHNWLMTRWMGNIRDVDVVGFAGYSDKHNAWIYPAFAVHKGRVIPKNTEDYIEINAKTRVKSAYHSVDISANTIMTDYTDDWFHDFYNAWGHRGIVALAFFTLSLFSEQVRTFNKSLAFLELVGDPGTGKTTLIEFLWKLLGRDSFEGFDPSSSNPAFVARALNQVSNLPAVMIEGDRMQRGSGHRSKFDWSETKKLYNGRSMKGRGMRTQGNETYEPPFRGSLIISQNAPVDAEQAVLERIVHIFFAKNDTSSNTLAAVKRLVGKTSSEVSGYLIKCLTQSDKMLETYQLHQPKYEEEYRNREAQKTYRLALNHSQIAAALHMLKLVTPMQESTLKTCLDAVSQMSLTREKAIALEHPDVEQFFEVCEYIEEQGGFINHNGDGNGWAINLNEIYEKADKYRQQLQQQVILKPLLRASRRYTDTRAIHSRIKNSTIRCWIFKATQ